MHRAVNTGTTGFIQTYKAVNGVLVSRSHTGGQVTGNVRWAAGRGRAQGSDAMGDRQKVLRISVRRLVEFLLRSGSLESRSGPSGEAAMREGARIHRQIQKKGGEGYRAEVPLKLEIPLNEDGLPVLPVCTETALESELNVSGNDRIAPACGMTATDSDSSSPESDQTPVCPAPVSGQSPGNGAYGHDSPRTCAGNRDQVPSSDLFLCLEGRADGIFKKDSSDIFVVDEIKTVFRGLQEMREPEEVHLAQARCYAYMYAAKEGLDRIGIRMTYCGQVTGEIRFFYEEQSFEELSLWFFSLIRDYGPWIKRKLSFEESAIRTIRAVNFPFPYREGQFDLAAGVYRTIVHGRKLFLQAPTGTGKTLAVLFPALKAVGEGKAEKIFYLTAKNVTGRVALESLRLLYERGLCVRSLELVSKERSCVCDEVDCRSSSCPRADGHYDRINGALRDLLDGAEGGEPITAEKIADCAEKHRVCPYELSLDAADFSDVIICDYNYVFHPRVRLTRFFGDTEAAGKKNGTILLVDEAHNLLERGREMYSAEISAREVKQFRRSVRDRQPQLWKTLKDLVRVLNGMEKEAALKSAPGKSAPGAGGEICTFLPGELDPGLSTALQRVRDRIRWILEQDRRSEVLYTSFISGAGEYEGENKRGKGKTEPDTDGTGTGDAETDADTADINITDIKGKDKKGKNKKENNKTGNSRADTGKTQELLEFYFEITRFHEVLEMLDEHYIVYSVNKPARREGGGFNLHLYCADPSARLQNCEAASVSTICFSATFLPIQYYKGLLGGTGDDFEMYARSSFAPDQREVVIVKDVTSRYRDRRADNYERIARGIRQIAACRPGNYMVYFPSYAFLENVQEAFTRIFGIAAGSAEGTDDLEESREGITLLTQKPRMDDEERVSFLKAFENPRSGCSLIGFCVLGGMFGEGIDLRNDRLIGCLIVGTGIPPVEPRRELLREYFSSRGRNGYDYAYRFPGMNKVLQAAGRVIRTAEDAGVVALMDERFAERENRELFPPEWGIPREADSGGAAVIVSSFWENLSRGMKEEKFCKLVKD